MFTIIGAYGSCFTFTDNAKRTEGSDGVVSHAEYILLNIEEPPRQGQGRDIHDKDKVGACSLHKTGNGIDVVFASVWFALVCDRERLAGRRRCNEAVVDSGW